METPEPNVTKRNVLNGGSLPLYLKFIMDIKEWIHCHEKVGGSDKSKYSAKILWWSFMHYKIPKDSRLNTFGGRYHL